MSEHTRNLILIFGPIVASALLGIVYSQIEHIERYDSVTYILIDFVVASFVFSWLGFMWATDFPWPIRLFLSFVCAVVSFTICLVLTFSRLLRRPT